MLSVALALVLGAQGQATFNLVSSTACSATAKVANVTQLKAQVRMHHAYWQLRAQKRCGRI
jgi:hypothetical protein